MTRFTASLSVLAGIVAAVLVGCAATPGWAQPAAGVPTLGPHWDNPNPNAHRNSEFTIRNGLTPSRLLTLEQREFEASQAERQRRISPYGPERVADITAQLEQAGVACEVRGIKLVGRTPDRKSIYEAACGAGPGYVLVNGVDPKATSCLVLAGAAAQALRRNPAARTGAQCTLPENQNARQLIGAWAREAGVTCKVDEGEWLGSSDAGFDMYEIGCEGSEGYWLEKASSGWSLRGCLQVASEGLTCRYTHADEQRAWMRARLAGTPAQACDVAEIRVVGVSPQGSYYETRCSTPGEGFLVRIAGDGRAENVTSCTEARGRSIACSLTVPGAGRSEG